MRAVQTLVTISTCIQCNVKCPSPSFIVYNSQQLIQMSLMADQLESASSGSFTNVVFVYSGNCMFMSQISLQLCIALGTAIRLYRRTRSKYFVGFIIAIMLRFSEQFFSYFFSLPSTEADKALYHGILVGNAINYCLVGFWVTYLNTIRFVKVASKWNRHLARIAICLSIISFGLFCGGNGWYLKAMILRSGDAIEANRLFTSWAIVDSVVNAYISGCFLMYLQHLGSKTPECILVFAAYVSQFINQDMDPAWSTTSFVEAVRLRFLLGFFDVLRKVMRRNSSNAQLKLTAGTHHPHGAKGSGGGSIASAGQRSSGIGLLQTSDLGREG
ncbi:hypothetical protein BCR44DRAFT_1435260 [Catenaria anguillulae PL171]|uniref:Uncharacterized protein n=1 Tax=Catenaria anguillulae PL171 TaxID=765915 RepID=A0A1Y2HLJ1_9FUNG|nr:hypothetical protein BCR44DRAFT_1435260 [Catenaria anguillulae PL171]